MKQEELLKALILELMGTDKLHKEYQDNDTHFVIDSLKKNNTLIIKVQLLENEDKKEFEKWLENLDESLFEEVLEDLENEGLSDLNSMYNSDKYKDVIDKVKSKTKEIINKKIEMYKKLL